jgi:hypothetical protein
MDLYVMRVVAISGLILNVFLVAFYFLMQKFSTSLLIIHSLFFLACFIWAINPKAIFSHFRKNRWDLIILICLMLLAFSIRMYKIEEITPGMYGDEVSIAQAGEKILSPFEFTPFLDVNYGHPTPLLYLEGIFLKVFGRSPMAVRFPSLIFGVMDVGIFYIFLRAIFKKPIASAVTLVLVFSYPHIVVSRLAYEVTASIFFQILACIFLFYAYKTNKLRYWTGIGLALGVGLYTYVGFRTFAFCLVLASLIFLLKKKEAIKRKATYVMLIFFALFISTSPLLGYSLKNYDSIMARTESLSVFGQILPKGEAIKEIQGAAIRLSYVFFATGDPSPRSNPSGVSMFDMISTIVAGIGLIVLFRKSKSIFFISLFILIPSIVNDIFSLERIPEFHYYGLGHPNTLRIAGIIPIVYLWVAYGLRAIKNITEKINEQLYYVIGFFIMSCILIFNWNNYFNQDAINQHFYLYNYEFNGVRMINVARAINESMEKYVYLSPSFMDDSRVKYFSKNDVALKIFKPKSEQDALLIIQQNKLIIIDPRIDTALTQKLFEYFKDKQDLYGTYLQMNPIGGVDAVIFWKKN